MAELHAVFGDMTFSNRQNRDRSVAEMTRLAGAQGFETPTAPVFPDYPMGMTTVGTTGAKFCYTHTSEAVVDAALAALNAYFAANGRADGSFGSARISD